MIASPRRTWRGLLGGTAIAMACWLDFSGATRAQDDATPDAPASALSPEAVELDSSSIAPHPSTASPAPERKEVDPRWKERQEKAFFGAMAIVGIGCAGLLLIMLTMLWGWRVRRISRAPLPPVSPGPEFWFLKPDRSTGSYASAADAEADSDGDRR